MADPRLDIWNVLHDGEITVTAREAADVAIMFVSIPYVRRRIAPLGDSFRLRLGGFRGMHFENSIGDTDSELAEIEGYEILAILSDTMPAKIQLTQGTLTLDFDSLEMSLDSGQPVTYEEVLRVAQDYWDECAARTKQV
jgi:hypothetical protein